MRKMDENDMNYIVERLSQNKLGITKKTKRKYIHVCERWSVKGHTRHLQSGKITWVKAHERGKRRNEAMLLCS